MGLLLYSLGILSPFISSLPLVVFLGLPAINPTTLAHWLVSLFLYRFAPHFLLICLIVGFLLLLDPLSKMGINNIT